MKNKLIIYFLLLPSMFLNAQNEYHVFPKDHISNPGKPNGNGGLENPWDLQTALNQKHIKGGDKILLHQGVYRGRFVSTLQGLSNQKIMVTAINQDQVILDGNINESVHNYVLRVEGSNVIYKNFEVTFLGDFSRTNISNNSFKPVTGIDHISGGDCEFINLSIHDLPGSGIGSWKHTGGSKIEGCMIYNNGYLTKNRGRGVGVYVQNASEHERLIYNNIIFNNYYKGVEVWSATSGTGQEFVKNISLENNTIFNNGTPSGHFRGNVIIASNDAYGINVAKNITFKNNVLYHNSDFHDPNNFGDGVSLTLGYVSESPVEDISITDNVIIGKNNAINIFFAKSLNFSNNIIYAGYIHLNPSVLYNKEQLKFENNQYFTRKAKAFRILKTKDLSLNEWRQIYSFDGHSSWGQVKSFDLPKVLQCIPFNTFSRSYKVVLFDKDGNDIFLNVSNYAQVGANYKIFDAENPKSVMSEGVVNMDYQVEFSMKNLKLQKPLHNQNALKTAQNFGVFIIEFSELKAPEESLNLFDRLWDWIGF